jgi:hypothetical protein
MLALKHSLLSRKPTLIHVLEAMASVIAMCNLCVILLDKIIPIYFTRLMKDVFRLFNIK